MSPQHSTLYTLLSDIAVFLLHKTEQVLNPQSSEDVQLEGISWESSKIRKAIPDGTIAENWFIELWHRTWLGVQLEAAELFTIEMETRAILEKAIWLLWAEEIILRFTPKKGIVGSFMSKIDIDFIKGGIIKEVVKTLLQRYDYEVYPYGYETTFAVLKNKLSEEEVRTSPSVRRMKSTPDLVIFDKKKKKPDVCRSENAHELPCYD